jgi:hypothetical protein
MGTFMTRRQRPWWVWAAPFAAILAILLARNSGLFTSRYYETSDFGADSILVEQARHFTLLVGIYSRDYFNHPGPAYLYAQAAGQTVLYNVLHVVPSAWNGQVIALYVVNSALAGLIVLVVYGWAGYRGALAAIALLLGFAVMHVGVLTGVWMPYQDVPAFALFLLSAGSVAAGQRRDWWIAALSGWLLIHLQVGMLLFVPVLTVATVALAAWRVRHRLRESLRGVARDPRTWIPVVAISALFALPIALDVILHWPGQFGKYLTYDDSPTAGAHSHRATLGYVAWFWGPGLWGWLVALGLVVAAGIAIWLTRGPLRRYLAMLGAIAVVAQLLAVYYAATSVDEINEMYIGYFFWAVPLVFALIVTLAVLAALPRLAGRRSPVALAALGAVAAVAVFAAVPGTRTFTRTVDPEFSSREAQVMDPGLPGAVRDVAADAHGKTIVISLWHGDWGDMTGFLAQAERSGVSACVADSWWAFMVTSQQICTRQQLAKGAGFNFVPAGTKVRHPVATLIGSTIIRYTPPVS